MATTSQSGHAGLKSYYNSKIDELDIVYADKVQDLRRLQAQRNELNAKGQNHAIIFSQVLKFRIISRIEMDFSSQVERRIAISARAELLCWRNGQDKGFGQGTVIDCVSHVSIVIPGDPFDWNIAYHLLDHPQVGQEGKYIVKVDKSIDLAKLVVGTRVALRSDSYALYKILPTKVSNEIFSTASPSL
jgi:26S proteasome regulatory subunit T6